MSYLNGSGTGSSLTGVRPNRLELASISPTPTIELDADVVDLDQLVISEMSPLVLVTGSEEVNVDLVSQDGSNEDCTGSEPENPLSNKIVSGNDGNEANCPEMPTETDHGIGFMASLEAQRLEKIAAARAMLDEKEGDANGQDRNILAMTPPTTRPPLLLRTSITNRLSGIDNEPIFWREDILAATEKLGSEVPAGCSVMDSAPKGVKFKEALRVAPEVISGNRSPLSKTILALSGVVRLTEGFIELKKNAQQKTQSLLPRYYARQTRRDAEAIVLGVFNHEDPSKIRFNHGRQRELKAAILTARKDPISLDQAIETSGILSADLATVNSISHQASVRERVSTPKPRHYMAMTAVAGGLAVLSAVIIIRNPNEGKNSHNVALSAGITAEQPKIMTSQPVASEDTEKLKPTEIVPAPTVEVSESVATSSPEDIPENPRSTRDKKGTRTTPTTKKVTPAPSPNKPTNEWYTFTQKPGQSLVSLTKQINTATGSNYKPETVHAATNMSDTTSGQGSVKVCPNGVIQSGTPGGKRAGDCK